MLRRRSDLFLADTVPKRILKDVMVSDFFKRCLRFLKILKNFKDLNKLQYIILYKPDFAPTSLT